MDGSLTQDDLQTFLKKKLEELIVLYNFRDSTFELNPIVNEFLNKKGIQLTNLSYKQLFSELNLDFVAEKSSLEHATSSVSNFERQYIIDNQVTIINWWLIHIKDGTIMLLGHKQTNTKKLKDEIVFLENIIKYSPAMIYWKDKNSIHLGCNETFSYAVGYDNPKDIIGKTDYDLSWHSQAAKYNRDDQDVIKSGKPKLNIEDTIIDKNGETRYVITNKVPLRDLDEKIIGVLGITTDITDRKIMEEELRKSKTSQAQLEMLNNIIKYAPDLIYWKDKHSVHLGCNDRFAQAAGYKDQNDIIGKLDYDFPWHAQADKYLKDDQEVINSGEPKLNIPEIVKTIDGEEMQMLSNKVPLKNSLGEVVGVLGITTDITPQKKIEQALKAAKEAAEAANIAKTEFIANMSHDIRTPLSGVVGLGSIVEREIPDPSQRAKVHDMVKSADELLNMLNEILDVVTLGNITVNEIYEEPFDLFYLIQTILDLEKSSVDLKKIHLNCDIDEKIPKVLMGDHKKIHHIILNLVGNAIKFTKKGEVTIKISLTEKQIDKVTLLFEISDTGIGIPPEALDKVFELFYKITPSYKGLEKGHGVGLHIVKTYTELLGGKISVESQIDKGSMFALNLTLKIAEPKATPKNIIQDSLNKRSEEPPIWTTSMVSSQPKLANAPEILIIEDNPLALTIAQTLIGQARCNSTSAHDGESALELARTQDFDMILSDVGLPGISGIEFAKQWRQFEREHNKKPTAIVALTGHAEGKIHEECIAAGINEVIIKPIRPEILAAIFNKFALFGEKIDRPLPVQKSSLLTKIAGKSALGADLPDTEENLFTLKQFKLFDIEKAQKILGNNSTNLTNMIKMNLETIIPQELPKLRQAHADGDWNTVAHIVHKLKSGLVYVGLTQLAMACQYLERYYKAGHTKLLERLYDQVLKAIDITILELKPMLSK